MAAGRKHMGITTHRAQGATKVLRHRVEIGRVTPAGYYGGHHNALIRAGGLRGYNKIGTFPTHKAAVDAVARSTMHRHQLTPKVPGLKRPKNLNPFKKRSHPTQSLGV